MNRWVPFSFLLLRASLIQAALAVSLTLPLTAQQSFTAECIGISDGDTITVLREREQIKVRLYGIDTPEAGEPFSNKAKKFTSSLVYRRMVQVVPKDTDRYGRTVARVMVDETDVSRALVQAGLAWHYTKYSSDKDLANAESVAKNAELGLWSLPNPEPPWELPARAAASSTQPQEEQVIYHGNTRSRVFHAPWCRYYSCQNCTKIFRSREEAIKAGFKPGGHCRP